jgi:hypothetical protein
MFPNMYVLSHTYSRIMKLTNKITFSVQTPFLVQGRTAFRIIFNSDNYDRYPPNRNTDPEIHYSILSDELL